VRQVDFRLDFVTVAAPGTRGPGRGATLALRLEVSADLDRLMFFDRTGMSLLLGDTDNGEHIENSFAFDFQFPSQIVNSNLAHPPSISSGLSR
jgi:hypothetical protein